MRLRKWERDVFSQKYGGKKMRTEWALHEFARIRTKGEGELKRWTVSVALHIIPQTLRSAGVSIVWVRGLGFTETF